MEKSGGDFPSPAPWRLAGAVEVGRDLLPHHDATLDGSDGGGRSTNHDETTGQDGIERGIVERRGALRMRDRSATDDDGREKGRLAPVLLDLVHVVFPLFLLGFNDSRSFERQARESFS